MIQHRLDKAGGIGFAPIRKVGGDEQLGVVDGFPERDLIRLDGQAGDHRSGGQLIGRRIGHRTGLLGRQQPRPYRIRGSDLRPHLPTVRTLVGIGAPSFLAGFGATLLVVVVNTTLSRVAAATAAEAAA